MDVVIIVWILFVCLFVRLFVRLRAICFDYGCVLVRTDFSNIGKSAYFSEEAFNSAFKQ